jgi:hypothetical protein
MKTNQVGFAYLVRVSLDDIRPGFEVVFVHARKNFSSLRGEECSG